MTTAATRAGFGPEWLSSISPAVAAGTGRQQSTSGRAPRAITLNVRNEAGALSAFQRIASVREMLSSTAALSTDQIPDVVLPGSAFVADPDAFSQLDDQGYRIPTPGTVPNPGQATRPQDQQLQPSQPVGEKPPQTEPSGGSPNSNPVLPPVPSSAEPQRPVPSVQDVPVGFPASPAGSPVGSGVFKTLYVDPPPPEQKPFPLVSIEDTTAMEHRMPEAAGEKMELPSGTILEVTADAKSIIVTIPGQAPYLIASPNYYETVSGDSLTVSDPSVPGLVPASPAPPRMLHGIDPDGNPVDIYISSRPELVSPLSNAEPAKYVRVNYSDGTSGLAALNWRGEYLYPVDKYHRQKEAPAPDPFMEKSFWENTVSFGAGLVSPVWDSVKDAGAKAGIGGPGVENAWMDSLYGMGSLVGLGREGGPGVLDTWKALGKDLIAWDEWARGDWSYATGIVVSNLITTVGTDGAGLALKINKITSRLPDVDVPVSKTDGTGPSVEKPNTTQPGGRTEQPKADEPAPQPKPQAEAPKNEPTHTTGDADQTPEPTRPDPVQDQPPGPPVGPPDFPAGGIEFPGPKEPSNGIGEIPQKLAAPNGITGRTGNPDLPNGLMLNPFRRDPLVGASVPRRTPDKLDHDAAIPDRRADSDPVGLGRGSDDATTAHNSSKVTAETQAVFKAQVNGNAGSGSSGDRPAWQDDWDAWEQQQGGATSSSSSGWDEFDAQEKQKAEKEKQKSKPSQPAVRQPNKWDDVKSDVDPEKIQIGSKMTHILWGDHTGGGHHFESAEPGKNVFPEGWDESKIEDVVLDIARNPDAIPVYQLGTEKQPKDRWLVEGRRDGVDVVVVLELDGKVVSAIPQGGKDSKGKAVMRNDDDGNPQPLRELG
ncbi:hypothetical protein ACFV4K_13895 [Nocardia sp. NPDC059764]|uniref:hypothetical protein n=1 Tax=Nocardia sp. NPDC059764 TaxID=3346939 RepID=UPI00364A76F9